MRGAIERLIADLERQKTLALQNQKKAEGFWAFKHWGIECGLEEAISHLKAVLANEQSIHTD